MKNRLLGLLALTTMFFMYSCSDESSDPTGGGPDQVSCKLISITSDDGSMSSMTWDGDKLTKITESDSFDTYSIIFNYSGDKLDEIIDEDDVYKMTYSGDKITMIEESYLGDVEWMFELTYDGDNISEVKGYDMEGGKVLYETYTYTYSNGNVTNMLNKYDDDSDGTLESEITLVVSSYDDKPNPYHRTPLMYMEFDNPLNFSKNNALSAAMSFDGTPLNYNQSIEYNAEGYPAKVTTDITLFGTTVSNLAYSCN